MATHIKSTRRTAHLKSTRRTVHIKSTAGMCTLRVRQESAHLKYDRIVYIKSMNGYAH